MREAVEGPKKKKFEDPLNAQIQQKFDMVFGRDEEEHLRDIEEGNLEEDSSMGESAKKPQDISSPKLDLNFDSDDGNELEFDGPSSQQVPSTEAPKKEGSKTKLTVVPDDSGIEFSLDLGEEAVEEAPEVPNPPEALLENDKTISSSNFEIPEFETELETISAKSSADADMEGTLKTILYDKNKIEVPDFESLSLNETTGSSSNVLSPEEAKANIESTIKDILRPKNLEATQEIDLSSLSEDNDEFELDAIDKKAVPDNDLDEEVSFVAPEVKKTTPPTGEFDLDALGFAGTEEVEKAVPRKEEVSSMPMERTAHTSFVSDEESTRLQATIRQLREEREELLSQVKSLKVDTRELEQDNLTLKAALDESKIEISILRKRHLVELEDMKYRLSLNEEKKSLAEEKARIAETKREKLEQRVRIDFNQVKQREKELETKLEMMSIDVDSQVQTRDQKILELRRKIDALEFNMENVSIREQKSQDDKRKLEDKLNKIMKTLRHSIKNLEDDIDQVTDDRQDDTESDDHKV